MSEVFGGKPEQRKGPPEGVDEQKKDSVRQVSEVMEAHLETLRGNLEIYLLSPDADPDVVRSITDAVTELSQALARTHYVRPGESAEDFKSALDAFSEKLRQRRIQE